MTRYLYFTVFIAGMTTLAIELTASRLLGSYFGTSNLVWASIIGLILIYLTAGYLIGGRWADRSPYPRTLYTILIGAGLLSSIVPAIARPVLQLAAQAFDQLEIGVLFGSFAAVLILFSLPITLLGTISPFAVRLAIERPESAGWISGRIYAISTLGSFLGTFLPVLFLIPAIGTTKTIILFSVILILVALIGLRQFTNSRVFIAWLLFSLLVLLSVIIFNSSAIKRTEGLIYESESAYNYIQVIEKDDNRLLRLNEGQGIHSIWHPTNLNFNGPWKQFLVAPFFNDPEFGPEKIERMLIIGLAAGTTAQQATAVFGPIPIDGYEIDPEIIKVGRQFFNMNLTNLNPMAEDGRVGLARNKEQYSIIGIDAYRPPYIPWHMTTREFFKIVGEHLTLDGTIAINVGRSPSDRSLLDGLVATIQTIFPSVYVMDVPNTFNSIIYATTQSTSIDNLYNNLLYLYTREDIHPLLIQAIEAMIINQTPTARTGRIFTDDLAPIEWITNRMILNYILYGDIEDLQ